MAVLAFLGVLLLAACAAPHPGATFMMPTGGSSVRVVVADWQDVEAAVEVAVRHAELTVLDRELGPRFKKFNLQSVAAEPGHLTATPVAPGPRGKHPSQEEPMEIRLEVRVGLFGNPAREEALLRAMAHRLEQLRGRDWAPVR